MRPSLVWLAVQVRAQQLTLLLSASLTPSSLPGESLNPASLWKKRKGRRNVMTSISTGYLQCQAAAASSLGSVSVPFHCPASEIRQLQTHGCKNTWRYGCLVKEAEKGNVGN